MKVIRWARRVCVLAVLVVFFTTQASPAAVAANGAVLYTYDALGRVTVATYDTGVCVNYSYDANGNRTSQSVSLIGTWGCFLWGSVPWGG
ncbi:MAG: RHS repeat protein [Alphaproteobacteria bacterium]|nr:RHS repeat protein [Alphaproteobacteria bacterium]